MNPKVRRDLTVVELDGELVVYDGSTRALHQLNPSATVVWSLCDGVSPIEQIAADIASTFGAPLDQVIPEVTRTVQTFSDAGLLESSASQN